MNRRLLPLNALRAFAAVHETGGIRSAARALDVAHSSVGRHVRFLEETLGVALLDRGGDGLGLRFTPQGERLGRAAGAALSALEGAMAEAREARGRDSVVVSAAPSFASRWLMDRLERFNGEFPRIEVSVLVDRKLTGLDEDGADIGIRIGDGAWGESAYRALMDETLFPVCSPRVAEGLGDIRDPACLGKAKLLHDRDPQASWAAWRDALGLGWLDPAPGARFTSSDTLLGAAERGLGVALARGRLAESALRDGRLVRLAAPLEVGIPAAYWILVNPGSAGRKAVKALAAWLREEGARPGAWTRE